MIIYVVCDIESDGPIPGPNSMISFGAVAVDRFGENFGEFEINLHPLKYANSDPVTIKWFNESAPEAFEYTKCLDPEGVPCYVKDGGRRDGM